MSHRTDPVPSPFYPQERELIRRELCRHFGEDPRAADGLLLRTWRSGPQAGQPKLPPAIRSMLERGLVEIRTGTGARAFFTPAGLAALRQLLSTAAPWIPPSSRNYGASSAWTAGRVV